jgi:hypothetical protein
LALKLAEIIGEYARAAATVRDRRHGRAKNPEGQPRGESG